MTDKPDIDAILAKATPIQPSVIDWEAAALVCREVAELPDRDSSDLNPDEMIVTGDELQPIVAAAIAEGRFAGKQENAVVCESMREALKRIYTTLSLSAQLADRKLFPVTADRIADDLARIRELVPEMVTK